MYNKPTIEINAVETTRIMDGLLGSGTGPQPAPKSTGAHIELP